DALKCQTGLAKGLAKFKKTKIKLWSKCLDTINKGGTCDQSAVNTGIGTTAVKVVAKVGSTCTDAIAFGAQPNGGGYAMNCQLEGTTPPLEAPEQACFNMSVTNVSQLVSCLICWHEAELDEWLHVVYPCPNPNPVPAGSDLDCGTPPGICPPT